MALSRPFGLRSFALLLALGAAVLAGTVRTPLAEATPPPNDEFANRTVIPSTLPVEVEGSNIGATDGSGDLLLGFAHHSVWWEWEAPETRDVSIGTCGTTFAPVVEVFAKAEGPGARSEIVPADGNPLDCSAQFLFRATAGTKYQIMVAGHESPPPPPGAPPPENGEVPVPPASEGTIRLGIAPTPPPPNDDFENAATMTTNVWEDPDGTRRTMANLPGYTWEATGQPEEPAHAGKGVGASVWFSWTPTESGPASFTPNAPSERAVVGVYTGSALGQLTPVGSCVSSGRGYCFANFYAEAGRRYSIAVDSAAEAGEAPWMGSFFSMLVQQLPRGPGYRTQVAPAASTAPGGTAPSAPGPQAPPSPRLRARSIDAAHRRAVIRFSDPVPGARFRCQVDRGRFRECSSPATVRSLEPGRHRFAVVAHVDGGPRSRPTVTYFRIPAAHRG